MKVKLLKAVGPRQAGEVIDVDSGSAKSLVENKRVAEYFDPEKHDDNVARSGPPRGTVTAQAIVDADEPVPAADPVPAEQPADDKPAEASMSDSLAELRARAVAEGKATEDEAKALTKAQLVDKLTS